MPRASNRAIARNGKRSQRQQDAMPRVPRIALGNRMQYGFPPVVLTKLRYVDTYALISTAGSLAKQVLYLNSTFDPDNTGVGHQPLYRDTYASIYDQYAVVSCHVKAQYQNLAAGTGFHIGLVLDDDNSSSSTVTTLQEQNYGQHELLPPLLSSISNRTLEFDWDCKKHLGINPYDSQTYKTSVGSNPSEIASLIVWSAPADGSTTGTVQIQITMEFTVLFTELQSPTQS